MFQPLLIGRTGVMGANTHYRCLSRIYYFPVIVQPLTPLAGDQVVSPALSLAVTHSGDRRLPL